MITGGIKKSKYHKNTSEINELGRELIPAEILQKSVERQKKLENIRNPQITLRKPCVYLKFD